MFRTTDRSNFISDTCHVPRAKRPHVVTCWLQLVVWVRWCPPAVDGSDFPQCDRILTHSHLLEADLCYTCQQGGTPGSVWGSVRSNKHLCVCLCVCLQGICQGERAGGEEAGVPEAPQTTADRKRAYRIPGVDLQSRSDPLSFSLSLSLSLFLIHTLTLSFCSHTHIKNAVVFDTSCPGCFKLRCVFVLQRRWCWRRKTRTQGGCLWMDPGTKGNNTTLVRSVFSRIYTTDRKINFRVI